MHQCYLPSSGKASKKSSLSCILKMSKCLVNCVGNSILIGGVELRPGDMVICHKILIVQFGQYWIWDRGQNNSTVKEGPIKKSQVSCWRFWITACRSEVIDWQFCSNLFCNQLLNLNFSRKDAVNLLPSPGSLLLCYSFLSWTKPLHTYQFLKVFNSFLVDSVYWVQHFLFFMTKPIMGKM